MSKCTKGVVTSTAKRIACLLFALHSVHDHTPDVAAHHAPHRDRRDCGVVERGIDD